jgi:hypothetical protein
LAWENDRLRREETFGETETREKDRVKLFSEETIKSSKMGTIIVKKKGRLKRDKEMKTGRRR